MDRKDRSQNVRANEIAVLHKGFSNECEVRVITMRRRTVIVVKDGYKTIVPKSCLTSKADVVFEKLSKGQDAAVSDTTKDDQRTEPS